MFAQHSMVWAVPPILFDTNIDSSGNLCVYQISSEITKKNHQPIQTTRQYACTVLAILKVLLKMSRIIYQTKNGNLGFFFSEDMEVWYANRSFEKKTNSETKRWNCNEGLNL